VRWLSKLVSIVVLVAIVAALALLMRTQLPETSVGDSFRTWALFRDGSRLAIGSQVVIAGVRVGEVEKLTIDRGFARVDLVLRDDTDIPVDSWITKKAVSAFGDSYLEIIPTGGEAGAPTARRLKSGEQITHVQEGGSTDSVLRAIAKTMPKIDQGLDSVHDFSLSGRRWINGPFADRIVDIDRWVAQSNIEGPIENAERALERAEAATDSAATQVADAAPGVNRALDRFDRGVTSARSRMTELRTDLHDGLANARTSFDRIDPAVADLAEVMTSIDENRSSSDYKGTLGKLVNDPALGESIEDLSESGKDVLGTYNQFQSFLGLRLELNGYARAARIYATAEIRARHDKFYLVEFEKGPLGGVSRDSVSDNPNVPQWLRHQEIRDEIRFTFQFGKTLDGWLQVRGGIKDSTFGVGADALIRGGSLRLSADLFGSFETVPRLKLAAALEVFRYTYILAGVDDALNAPVYLNLVRGNTDVPVQYDQVRLGRDYFLGATIHFTDEDLAALIRIYGALLVGFL
jgi:phospholipid/cholesterol/gamma-HCH transport system substrate-binding protein